MFALSGMVTAESSPSLAFFDHNGMGIAAIWMDDGDGDSRQQTVATLP